jgi:hypothetical protein
MKAGPGTSSARIAKHAGISPERLRAFIHRNKVAKRKTAPGRSRKQVLATTRGQRRWIEVGFEAASLVGSPNETIKRFRRTNNLSVLEPFQGQARLARAAPERRQAKAGH